MLDYRSRLTAKQALEHPFFSQEPRACEPKKLLPPEILNQDSGVDYHEFITKCEKNKKKDFRKSFTFKHNLDLEAPLAMLGSVKNFDFMRVTAL